MFSYEPLHMTEQKQVDILEPTYSSCVRIRDIALRTCQKRWTEGWQERVRDIHARGTTRWWYILLYSIYLEGYCNAKWLSGRTINFIVRDFLKEWTRCFMFKFFGRCKHGITWHVRKPFWVTIVSCEVFKCHTE